MRGASALGALLHQLPSARVRVLVVWEPVLDSDVGPPSETVRKPLADPRVVEFWDPHGWMSPRALARARMMGKQVPDNAVAWDFVAIYQAGAHWEEPFPAPSWHGEPVVRSLQPVDHLLRSP